MTNVLFLVLAGNFALIWASIGVTRSYSSRPFLCALVSANAKPHQLHALGWLGGRSCTPVFG